MDIFMQFTAVQLRINCVLKSGMVCVPTTLVSVANERHSKQQPGRADFEQTIVDKAIDQWRKWLEAYDKAKKHIKL